MTKMTYIRDKNYYNYKTLHFILLITASSFSGQLLFNSMSTFAFQLSAIVFIISILGMIWVSRKSKSYIQNAIIIGNDSLTIYNQDQVVDTFSLDSEAIDHIKIKINQGSFWKREKQFIEIHTKEGSKTYYFQTTSQYNYQKVLDLIPNWKNNGIQVHQL